MVLTYNLSSLSEIIENSKLCLKFKLKLFQQLWQNLDDCTHTCNVDSYQCWKTRGLPYFYPTKQIVIRKITPLAARTIESQKLKLDCSCFATTLPTPATIEMLYYFYILLSLWPPLTSHQNLTIVAARSWFRYCCWLMFEFIPYNVYSKIIQKQCQKHAFSIWQKVDYWRL